MKNAEWFIKNGYKFSDVHYCFSISRNVVSFYLNGKIVGKALGTSYLAAFTEWLDAERKEPILADASDDMSFPSFREGEMYDGMERNKRYTLKELGL